MSFYLDLRVPELDEQLARHLEVAAREAGGLPVITQPRRWWWRRIEVHLHEYAGDRHLLSDDADFDKPAFALDPEVRELLARSIEAIGAVAPPGWSIHAGWVDDDVERIASVTPAELAQLARESALLRTVRYRVIDARG